MTTQEITVRIAKTIQEQQYEPLTAEVIITETCPKKKYGERLDELLDLASDKVFGYLSGGEEQPEGEEALAGEEGDEEGTDEGEYEEGTEEGTDEGEYEEGVEEEGVEEEGVEEEGVEEEGVEEEGVEEEGVEEEGEFEDFFEDDPGGEVE